MSSKLRAITARHKLLLAVALAALATRGDAYVRSRTSHGTAVFWPANCAYFQPDSQITSPTIPAASSVYAVVQKAMMNWQNATSSCSYFRLLYDQPAAVEAHYDGKNVIKFRTDRWCHPDDAYTHNQCYDEMAAAITTVFYNDHPGHSDDGRILDADVELNAINFTFVLLSDPPPSPLPTGQPSTRIADLENTLTHELGHSQGLDHTCKDAATPANEVDENGNPPPPCNQLGVLPPAVRDRIRTATMYNLAPEGDIGKRMPKADDIAGICSIYPKAMDPHHCEHSSLPGQGGCSFLGGERGASGDAGLLVLTLGGAAVLMRRRGRAGRA